MFLAEIWKILEFLSENFPFLVVKISVYLNRRFSVMLIRTLCPLIHYKSEWLYDWTATIMIRSHGSMLRPACALPVKLQAQILQGAVKIRTVTFRNSLEQSKICCCCLFFLLFFFFFCEKGLLSPSWQQWMCPNVEIEECISETQGWKG